MKYLIAIMGLTGTQTHTPPLILPFVLDEVGCREAIKANGSLMQHLNRRTTELSRDPVVVVGSCVEVDPKLSKALVEGLSKED